MALSRPVRILSVLAVVAAGCFSNEPPEILSIGDKTVKANTPLEFDVAVKDADSDKVTLTMQGAPKGVDFNVIDGKLAKFKWIPNPAMEGVHTITFTADDGDGKDTETINVMVQAEESKALKLLSPDRYTYDVNAMSTVKFTLDVQSDTGDLDFEFDPDPQDWGAVIEPSGRRVRFSWEPTAAQKAVAQHQFLFRVSDFDGNSLEKTISIIFRGQSNQTEECPGTVNPTVEVEEVPNQSGAAEVYVTAHVTDDRSPISQADLFWTTNPEAEARDWARVQMDQNNETDFVGVIELTGLEPGQSQDITWYVCAADDDDPDSVWCDGYACTEHHTFVASAALGFCDPCSAGQCGDALCVPAYGGGFCGRGCTQSADCPEGFYCEDIEDGASTRKQCVPTGCFFGETDPECSCAAGLASAPVPGDLVVNEVLFNPPETCPEGMPTCTTAEKLVADINGDGVRRSYENEEEFVEIVNPTDKYLDLEGVTLADADRVRFTFPDFVLPPGRAVLVFGGGDPGMFASLGGAFVFSARATSSNTGLQLNNGAETVTLKSGETTIATATWSSNANGISIVRSTEGSDTAAFSNHTTAPGASGTKWSPGTHTCGLPFPLDAQACVPPACTVVNRDAEPDSDSRSTAPCVRPGTSSVTVESTLNVNPPSGLEDARDIYVIEGRANQRLVVTTNAGAAPDIEDTYVRLYSRAGALLEYNDDDPDRPGQYYSKLSFLLPADGFYYLEVTPFVIEDFPVSGSYRVTVQLTTQ